MGEILRGVWRSKADQVVVLEDGFEVRMKLPELLAGSEDFRHMAEGVYRQESERCLRESLPFPKDKQEKVVAEIERGLKLAFVEWLTAAAPKLEEMCHVLHWTGLSMTDLQGLLEAEPGRFAALWRALAIVADRNQAADALRMVGLLHTAQHDGDSVELVRQLGKRLNLDPDLVAYFEAAMSRREKGKADLATSVVNAITKEY